MKNGKCLNGPQCKIVEKNEKTSHNFYWYAKHIIFIIENEYRTLFVDNAIFLITKNILSLDYAM